MNTIQRERRMGAIYVTVESIMQNSSSTHVSDILTFINFSPISTRYLPDIRTFKYVGYSREFDKLKTGEKIPTYHIIYPENSSGMAIERNEN